MENKSYSLVKFLKKENIPFSNIWYYISDKNGKKKPIGEFNKITDANEIKTKWYIDGRKPPKSYFLGKEEIKLSKTEQESLKFSVSIYLKASPENIYCLDIDDVNIKSIDDLISFDKKFEVFKGCPYLQGNTKGIHIYLKIDNLPIEAKELSVINGIDGDLIRKNNNMWERMDKVVLGGKKLVSFEFEDIKDVFNTRIYGVIEKEEKEKKEIVRAVNSDDFAKVNIADAKTKSDANFQEINDERLKVLNLIKTSRYDEYDDWYQMLWAFKSCGFSFQVFDEFSKFSKNYSSDGNLNIWNSAKICKDLNFGFFHYLAKTDSPEEYNKLDFDFVDDEEKGEWIEYTNKYLLKENQSLISNETILENNINKWVSDESIKSLNVKSPYGTGKTQMIKAILNTFKFPRIIWLTYRKTLTNDLMGDAGFSEFGFADYQKDSIRSDRLIIQLESVRRLEDLMIPFDDFSEFPSYDLVIVDEIESVLNHFSSFDTFKNQCFDAFEFVKNVIFNSSKILSLDGDLGNRAIDYIESFGASINIRNNIKINLKNFIITEHYDYFIKDIEDNLKLGRNCAVVSMSATECETIKECFNKKFPDKVVLIYTGISSDKDKEQLKCVKTIWKTCNLLLYSPSIEAGVSFDIEHFYKIYGLIVESTTYRCFSQMLSRIRQVESDEILLYNPIFKNHRVLDHQFYKYDDIKQSVLLLESVKLRPQTKLINGKMCKVNQLSEYDINYIHNRCERLNSNGFYFLESFIKLMKKKGHTITKLFDKPEDRKAQEIFDYKVSKIETITNAKDIISAEFEILIEKQKRDDATKEEKLSITKAIYKKSLGVDKIDEEFLKTFSPNAIYKFISLIDIKNITKSEDLQVKEEIDKAIQIKKLVNDLGFKNIFDTEYIVKDTFEKIKKDVIKNNSLFNDFNSTKARFNLNKTVKSVDGRAFNGFVNQLLNQYHLHLKYDQKTVNKEVVSVYKLVQMNDINELLQYKINKGFKIEDSENIRPIATTKTYNRLLFNFEESEVNEWNEWIQSVQPSEINQKKYHSIFCAKYPQYCNPLDAGIDI